MSEDPAKSPSDHWAGTCAPVPQGRSGYRPARLLVGIACLLAALPDGAPAQTGAAPTLTISSAATEPVGAAAFQILFQFSEQVSGFESSDVAVINGSLSGFQTASGQNQWQANVVPRTGGTVTVSVGSNAVQDADANGNESATFSIEADTTKPALVITSTSSSPVGSASFKVFFQFSEAVTGFAAADVSVTNGSLTNFQTALLTNRWEADLTPSAGGTVSVSVDAGAAMDSAGNESLAAQFSIQADSTPPSLVISSPASAPVGAASFQVFFQFSEAVTGFAAADVSVTNGTLANFATATGSNRWQADVTATQGGMVSVEVSSGAAEDALKNSSASASFSIAADSTRPEVVIAHTASSTGGAGVFTVFFQFSEAVSDFTDSDVTVTGGTKSGFQTASGSNRWQVEVTPASGGTATVSIAADAVQDSLGNNNRAASKSLTDTTAPSLTITSPAAAPVGSGAFKVYFQFSKPVTGFAAADVSVTNGSLANFIQTSGLNRWEGDVTPTAGGNVTVTVAEGAAADSMSNSSGAASFTIAADSTAPGLTITSPATAPVGSSAFTVYFQFSEPVSGFDATDVSVTNGTASGFTMSAVGHQRWQAQITPQGGGTVTVQVASRAAADALGNQSGSASFSIMAESMGPTLAITSAATAPVGSSAFTVFFQFSETVSGFDSTDVSVTNGTLANFQAVTGHYRWSAEITAGSGQTVAVTVPTGAARDSLGNSSQSGSFTISANPVQALTASFGAASYTVDEEASVSIAVNLDQRADQQVVIPITTMPASGDFSLSAQSVTIGAGLLGGTILLNASDDADTDDESVSLAFGTLPAGVSSGSPATTTVSITDNDQLALTVSFGAATYSVTEGSTVSIALNLDQAADREVVVPLTTNPASGDFSLASQSVTFASGESAASVVLTASEDDDTDDESVSIAFGTLPADVSSGSQATTTVSITDNDQLALTVSFGAATYSVTEGATVSIALNLDQAADREVVVPLTTNPASGDFSLASQSVTFASGESAASVVLTASEDDDTDDESVSLGFGTLPADVSSGTQATTTVSITDNDQLALTVSFGAASYSVAENATVSIAIQLDQAADREVVIPLTTTPTSGDFSLAAQSVTFASGASSASVNLTASDDADTDDESVSLAFGSLPADVSSGSPATTTVSIADDDQTQLTASFGASAYSVTEGASVSITVNLNRAATSEVVIPISATPTGGDYSLSASSVTIASGSRSGTIDLTASEDTDTDDESVSLAFGTLPADVSSGSPATTTVSITDNDQLALTVSFGAAAYSVTEGQTVSITVNLDQAADREVVVPLATTPTTGDFTLAAQSVTFAAGESTATVNLTANDDVDTDDESVSLAFGTLPADVSSGTPATTTVSITDNDQLALTVSFGAAAYSVTEGQTVSITVNLDQAADREVVIPLVTTPMTGDFALAARTVTFGAGSSSATVGFTARADADTDDESVTLGFGTLPADVSAGSPATTAISIADDGVLGLAVSFGATVYNVGEGSTVSVGITLDRATDRELTIRIAPSPAAGSYALSAESVTIAAGESTGSIALTAHEDSDTSDERVVLEFGSLPPGVTEGSVPRTTVRIDDNDTPRPVSRPLTVRFGRERHATKEGAEPIEITVTLNQVARRRLAIPIEVAPVDGTDESDFTIAGLVEGALVFASGDRRLAFTLQANQDEDSKDEFVSLALGENLPSLVVARQPETAIVEIEDDDPPALTVNFDAPTYHATEGGDAVSVTVELNQPTDRTLRIPIEVAPQSPTEPADYTIAGLADGALSFAPGDRRLAFSVQANQDEDSDDEIVVLAFARNLPNRVRAGEPAAATVHIEDDDPVQLSVSFAMAAYTAPEGGEAVAVTIRLDQPTDRALRIPIEITPGEPTEPEDYRVAGLIEGALAFAVGESEQAFTVRANDDADSDDETVLLALGETLPDRVQRGQPDTALVSLADDDPVALRLRFDSAEYAAEEGGAAVPVTVKLDRAADRELRIPIEATPVEPTEAGDFSISGLEANALVFPLGASEQAFSISAVEDDDRIDESVRLGFGEALPPGVTAIAPEVAVVSIVDNDRTTEPLQLLSVSFAQAQYTATEGGEEANIEVRLAQPADRRVEVPLSVALQGGATAADYRGVPPEVVFEAGMRLVTIKVAAGLDQEPDSGESIVLGFASLPEAVQAGSIPETTVSFLERRTAQQFGRSLDAMLAVIARSVADSAQTAVESRFERKRQARRHGATQLQGPTLASSTLTQSQSPRPRSQASVGRRPVDERGHEFRPLSRPPAPGDPGNALTPDGRSGPGQALPERSGEGLRRPDRPASAAPLPFIGSPSSAESGLSRAVHALNPFERDPLAQPSGAAARRRRSQAEIRQANLSAAAFNVELGSAAKPSALDPVLWGQGDLLRFSGTVANAGTRYLGGLASAHLGLDLHVGDSILFGLAFMRSEAALDYTAGTVPGELGSSLNTAHPYVYWEPYDSFSAWYVGGLGSGQATVSEQGFAPTFKTGFGMHSGGTRTRLAKRKFGEFGLRSDFFLAHLRSTAPLPEGIGSARGEATRVRSMLDFVRDSSLSATKSLSLKAELGGRFDGGDANPGSGLEAGFRLGFLDFGSGFELALHARALLAHRGGYRDWGIGAQASWDPGRKGHGFRIAATPSRGQDGQGQTAIWSARGPVHDPQLNPLGAASQNRFDTEVAYGSDLLGRRGILTAYSRVRFDNRSREIRTGGELSLQQRLLLAMPLRINLEGVRRTSKHGRNDTGVLLRMSIPF